MLAVYAPSAHGHDEVPVGACGRHGPPGRRARRLLSGRPHDPQPLRWNGRPRQGVYANQPMTCQPTSASARHPSGLWRGHVNCHRPADHRRGRTSILRCFTAPCVDRLPRLSRGPGEQSYGPGVTSRSGRVPRQNPPPHLWGSPPPDPNGPMQPASRTRKAHAS